MKTVILSLVQQCINARTLHLPAANATCCRALATTRFPARACAGKVEQSGGEKEGSHPPLQPSIRARHKEGGGAQAWFHVARKKWNRHVSSREIRMGALNCSSPPPFKKKNERSPPHRHRLLTPQRFESWLQKRQRVLTCMASKCKSLTGREGRGRGKAFVGEGAAKGGVR